MGHARRGRRHLQRFEGIRCRKSPPGRMRSATSPQGGKRDARAIAKIHALEQPVIASGDSSLIETWDRLQSLDHLYWMSTKGGTDGEVSNYFSPTECVEAHGIFMAALADLEKRVGSYSQVAVGGSA